MKRLISSCAALVALAVLSTIPRRAEAFDVDRTYEVYIFNGYQKLDTGELRGTLLEYVDDNGYEACTYFATWASPVGVPSQVQLFLDELFTPGHTDCDLNSTISLPTLIFDSPDYENSGVDRLLQGQSIQNMVLAEDEDGSAFGIIMFDTNFPYTLIVEPSGAPAARELSALTVRSQ